MVKGGHPTGGAAGHDGAREEPVGTLVSATRFASMTGVSRERLRTWERRYGFPRPRRVGRGPRRYELADAPRVVAIRRAAEQGVPLSDAIAAWQAATPAGVSATALQAIPERLPAPVLLLSGPAPVRIEYINPTLAERLGSLAAGTELAAVAPWMAGSVCGAALDALFAGATGMRDCLHPAWSGFATETARSLLYPLPVEPGRAPLVAMVELDAPDERDLRSELAALKADRDRLHDLVDARDRWVIATSELAELFQRETGPALLQATAETIVRRLPPMDAGVAVYMGGELALGSSTRGLLGPCMVTVTAHADIAAVLRNGAPAWLEPATAAAFGAPADVVVLAVPVAVVGETLGAVLLVLDEPRPIAGEVQALFSVLSAAIGFALLRDRLVEGAREQGRFGPAE
ncbi:MAG TPA: MerR family transcriptional regulator [Solirubrobacteraceae bacterium]|nr:MerR family transcriptional regulator [Solirubrobacteraceae bacterium]